MLWSPEVCVPSSSLGCVLVSHPGWPPPTLPAYAREAAGLGKQGWKAAAVSQPRTHNEGQGSSSSLKSG